MKKILITGKNSYIGTSFEKWMLKYPNKYYVATIDMVHGDWEKQTFVGYDVIFHVAGIAHIEETKVNKILYYDINRDLTIKVAKKAKSEGVEQFIFLSSMSVYGIDVGVITPNTIPAPKNSYGQSKLEAEKLLMGLEDNSFKITILRPPMVYGKGCRGNYPRLADFVKKTPVFPNIENRRSMIYINNLCEFVRILIDNYYCGLFFPQNTEYVCIPKLVELISKFQGKQMKFTKLFNPIIRLLKSDITNKVFGDLIYERDMSTNVENYCISDFEESIFLTEGGKLGE